MSYTVSIRQKAEHTPISEFLKLFPLPLEEIDSVFGFVEFTSLYGG